MAVGVGGVVTARRCSFISFLFCRLRRAVAENFPPYFFHMATLRSLKDGEVGARSQQIDRKNQPLIIPKEKAGEREREEKREKRRLLSNDAVAAVNRRRNECESRSIKGPAAALLLRPSKQGCRHSQSLTSFFGSVKMSWRHRM